MRPPGPLDFVFSPPMVASIVSSRIGLERYARLETVASCSVS